MRIIFIRKYLPIITLLIFCSCMNNDDQVEVYKSKKIVKKIPQQDMNQPQQAKSPGKKLTWKTPTDWSESPGNSIRLVTFKLQTKSDIKSEVTIISLGGSAGGTVANFNRWRGQIGLEDLSGDDLKKTLSQVESKLGIYFYSFIKNIENNKGIIAASLQLDGRTIFVKAVGPIDLLVKQEETFLTFIKGIDEN